jgi:hypothetical protein
MSVPVYTMYVAHVDAVPSLSTTPHEINEPCTAEEVVKMWDAAKARITELEGALRLQKEMQDYALPKFDWGKSFLDAKAIDLLNRSAIAVDAALAGTQG